MSADLSPIPKGLTTIPGEIYTAKWIGPRGRDYHSILTLEPTEAHDGRVWGWSWLDGVEASGFQLYPEECDLLAADLMRRAALLRAHRAANTT